MPWRFLKRWRMRVDARRARLRPAELVQRVEKNGLSVLLDLDKERYYGVDEVGTRVWELLRAGMEFDQIVDHLATEYEAPRDQIAADVTRFLESLVEKQLVEAR